ncbi:hypothetical protein WR25_09713 [Diploscapter pachys]|uniref:Uncharacterized protein n=1 Tax=Diploscapter pachys TaxID=2018661 RepID=A0A2A2KZS6_9BILA|nr:hypothetical protein WR25_09713 [Diploscapter pachys]
MRSLIVIFSLFVVIFTVEYDILTSVSNQRTVYNELSDENCDYKLPTRQEEIVIGIGQIMLKLDKSACEKIESIYSLIGRKEAELSAKSKKELEYLVSAYQLRVFIGLFASLDSPERIEAPKDAMKLLQNIVLHVVKVTPEFSTLNVDY